MKIQIDIPENINKKLKVYRINQGYDNMKHAIVDILAEKLKIKEHKYAK